MRQRTYPGGTTSSATYDDDIRMIGTSRTISHVAQGKARIDEVASNRRVARDAAGRVTKMRGSSNRDPARREAGHHQAGHHQDGADVQLARVRQLRQELAGLSQAAPLEPLTDREATVLRLLRGTLSLREIGQELHLSPNTIKTHTRVIYRKLGVSTRRQAVEQGHRSGIC